MLLITSRNPNFFATRGIRAIARKYIRSVRLCDDVNLEGEHRKHNENKTVCKSKRILNNSAFNSQRSFINPANQSANRLTTIANQMLASYITDQSQRFSHGNAKQRREKSA